MTTNPSSPWYSTKPAARNRKPLGLTLPPATIAKLDKMAKAREISRSQMVQDLVDAANVKP